MIRHIAAAVVVVGLASSSLYAQSVVFTVNTASAAVHAGPSTATPVVGAARRGAVLEVRRELGSWVRVPWPTAKDGVGYVHVSSGSITRATSNQSARPGTNVTTVTNGTNGTAAAVPPTAADVQRTRPVAPSAAPVYITKNTHSLGMGGRMGGQTFGVAASARMWRTNRLGAQLDLSRYEMTDVTGTERVTSVQFEPSVLYALRDRVADDYWLRPYVGAGANFGRHSLTIDTLGPANSVSEDRSGLQAFGGGEMAFAAMPQFALSADVGYHWSRAPFAGHDFNGLGFAVSGHWYVK